MNAIIQAMQRDVRTVLERDPAARSVLEVVLCYPGVHAIWFHRAAHWLWRRGWLVTARWVSFVNRALTGIEIHPAARLGPGLFIDHGMGVVIGETAEVGENVTILHGVTLGGTSLKREKRHPTIGNNVVVGAGAKILGAFTVGAGSRIGAGSVVVQAVPEDCVVGGVPGRITFRNGQRVASEPDLDPRPLAGPPQRVVDRVDRDEANVDAMPQGAETAGAVP